MTWAADPCPVATWPQISTHDFAVSCADVDGAFWVGYVLDSGPDAPCGYFIAADTNGFGTCPYTNIAPGIGYPTGWHNVSVVWGPTAAVGIGAWVAAGPCGGVPTDEGSWGKLKKLYKDYR